MSQEKYSPFNHATSNLKVHQLIKESNEFADWQVTTAFYTSLKFIEGCLFPGTYKDPANGEARDFEKYIDYKGLYNRTMRPHASPHKIMKDFVENNLEEISGDYHDLYEICHTARYKNYKISDELLKLSLEALESIKLYCLDNQKG